MSELTALSWTLLASLGAFAGLVWAAGIVSPTPRTTTRWTRCPLDSRERSVRFLTSSRSGRDYDDVIACSRFGDGDPRCDKVCRIGGKLELAAPVMPEA